MHAYTSMMVKGGRKWGEGRGGTEGNREGGAYQETGREWGQVRGAQVKRD
jgi:hypothetical protein